MCSLSILRLIKRLVKHKDTVPSSMCFSKPMISEDPSVTYRNFKYHYDLLINYFDDHIIPFLNNCTDLTETYSIFKGMSGISVISNTYIDLVKYLSSTRESDFSVSARFRLINGNVDHLENTIFGHKVSIGTMLDYYGLTFNQHIGVVEYDSKFIDLVYDCYALEQIKSEWQVSASETA